MSNGHLAWQLVHEAVRLSICQNAASAVPTPSNTHRHTDKTHYLFCSSVFHLCHRVPPRKSQHSIMDVALSLDAL